MAFTVETGAGIAGANSYLSVPAFSAYLTDIGAAVPATGAEAALVRASAWLDGRYRSRFPGTRANGRAQGLEWPRAGAADVSGHAISATEIPVEVLNATAEAARRELASPGALAPDAPAGGAIKRIRKKVDVLETETEYADAGTAGGAGAPGFPLIDGIMSGLIGTGAGFPAVLVV